MYDVLREIEECVVGNLLAFSQIKSSKERQRVRYFIYELVRYIFTVGQIQID
jgi:hypothetical protein